MDTAQRWVLAALLFWAVLGRAEIETQSVDSFLDALAGAWTGRAVQTPIGPAPYNVNFTRDPDNCVGGAVTNRFSRHTWRFCGQNQRLSLRFLSDFNDNDRPIHFIQTGLSGAVRTFYAETHPYMQVQLAIQSTRGWIKVIHHGEVHVAIELSRAAPSGESSRAGE